MSYIVSSSLILSGVALLLNIWFTHSTREMVRKVEEVYDRETNT